MEKKKYAWHFNIQYLFKVLPIVISLLTSGLVNIGKILKSQSLEGKPVDRWFFWLILTCMISIKVAKAVSASELLV